MMFWMWLMLLRIDSCENHEQSDNKRCSFHHHDMQCACSVPVTSSNFVLVEVNKKQRMMSISRF